MTAAHIYTFPSAFTYNGTANGYGTGIHLKEGTSGSLTLTFTGGDLLHSSVISTQLEYVKFAQSGVDTTISSSSLACSDPLETVTVSSITPGSTADLTLKVKLRGPDGALSSEITALVPSAQIMAAIQTVRSIYNIDATTRARTSGFSPDSSAGSLIVALPLDSLTEVSSQINTSTSTKTVTWRSGYVTTSTSRYYGSSYTIRTPSTGYGNVMTSFLVGGFSSPLEAYFNNNFTLEMWIRPTIPANPPDTGNVLLQTGVWGQSNQIAMYCNIDNSYSASNLGRIAVYNRSAPALYYGTRVLTVGNWHHLAFVRSGSTFVVYINGVSSMSFPTWTMQSMTTFCVGGFNRSEYEYEDFYGNVQDLRMYSTAKYTGSFTVA
jgi:hypothetical protein